MLSISTITNSSIGVQIIMMTLLLMSIMTFKIFFQSMYQLIVWKYSSEHFLQQYRKLEELPSDFEPTDPLSSIFKISIIEWSACVGENYVITTDRTRRACEAARIQWFATFEQNIGYLNIIASISPYIGLLGTVIGIMHCFTLMETTQSIAIMGPGIAEALITTASGLFVAISSTSVSYYFDCKMDHWRDKITCFAQQLTKDLLNDVK